MTTQSPTPAPCTVRPASYGWAVCRDGVTVVGVRKREDAERLAAEFNARRAIVGAVGVVVRAKARQEVERV